MWGAIAGDVLGSIYEQHPIKTTDFPLFGPRCRFTDDTVMTVAAADSILGRAMYADCMRQSVMHFPNAGYGGSFPCWLV